MNEQTATPEAECCPVFHPEKWDEKTSAWDHKRFITDSIPTLFHVPLPSMIGSRITRMNKHAEDAHMLDEDKTDTLVLFHDPSAFRSDMFLSTTGEVPEEKNVTMSGTFVSKVYDGPYTEAPKFIKEMNEYLATRGLRPEDYYFHYAYCPKCAEKFGHNYTVLFARLAEAK